jgi:hypothetical protein
MNPLLTVAVRVSSSSSSDGSALIGSGDSLSTGGRSDGGLLDAASRSNAAPSSVAQAWAGEPLGEPVAKARR